MGTPTLSSNLSGVSLFSKILPVMNQPEKVPLLIVSALYLFVCVVLPPETAPALKSLIHIGLPALHEKGPPDGELCHDRTR